MSARTLSTCHGLKRRALNNVHARGSILHSAVFLAVSPKFVVRIPENHLVERDAKLGTRIPPKMLVREEKHLVEFL
jgi:hypothetical protein